MISMIVLLLTAIVAMFWPRRLPNFAFVAVMVLGLAAAIWALILPNPLAQFPMLEFSRFTMIFGGLFIGLTAIVILMLSRGVRLLNGHISEYAVLVLFSAIGALVLISCTHMVTFFLGIEILSIPLYVLAASNTRSSASHEAGLKYFILGSVASAIMLFGLALLFAQTGQLYLSELLGQLSMGIPNSITLVALCLFLFGLFFKIGLVPFHFWVPDVYQGTPLVFTGFMATVAKGAALVMLFRIFGTGNTPVILSYAIWNFAALSMIVGNLIALKQSSFKRILAYSSVAHSGYIAMLLLAGTSAAAFILFFYILAYSLSVLTLFYIYDLKTSTTTDTLEPLQGLARQHPILGIAFVFAVLSLSGIPPLAGFFAKYVLFVPLMATGNTALLLVAVVSSVIGAVYYLRLLPLLFQSASEGPTVSKPAHALVVLLTVLSVLIGIFPGFLALLFH